MNEIDITWIDIEPDLDLKNPILQKNSKQPIMVSTSLKPINEKVLNAFKERIDYDGN